MSSPAHRELTEGTAASGQACDSVPRSNVAAAKEDTLSLRQNLNSALAQDIVTFGAGALVSAGVGTLQVFVIPRLVSVEDYGYWRLFLLYAAQVGLLHLGFADGALLHWAGRRMSDFGGELRSAAKFLAIQNLLLIAPLSLVALAALPASPVRFVAIAVIFFSVLMNLFTLFQFGFQAGREFRAPAIATAVAPATFLASVCLYGLRGSPDYRVLVAFYLLAYAAALLYLLYRARRTLRESSPGDILGFGRLQIRAGWPILLGNFSCGLILASDRLVMSFISPVREFAQYSFAVSTMFVPTILILTIAQVFFPHLAATPLEKRSESYKSMFRLLALAWCLLLPYYFVLSAIVRSFLSSYSQSLPVARVLLISVLFFGWVVILQSNFFKLYGWQKTYFKHAVVMVFVSVAAVLGGSKMHNPSIGVATGLTVSIAVWWAWNEWTLRRVTGLLNIHRIATLGIASVVLFCLWVSEKISGNWLVQIGCFLALAWLPLALRHSHELQSCWRFVSPNSAYSSAAVLREPEAKTASGEIVR